ncbi:hypothetical protein DVP62_05385 [Yersinia enterocolitica]|nr:hypothetical protein [Yersinia enterocolitica]EKN6162718.1 hypothetical protein [Yersinia enterocolitica]EKN6238935.1 hypothetical protein [Yersinia enterocolitica]EKN6317606.1 hypothetical protein [Yersinia enterocolitica]
MSPSPLLLSSLLFILYPSYFKLHVRWLLSFTRITYLSKLIGIHSIAAFPQLKLFGIYCCS